MAENNEKKQAMWLEKDIEPTREFENGEFKRLIQYADKNQNNLMSLLYNDHSDELRLGCKLGTSKLHYFENAISEDEKVLTIFKLGELYGHIRCLGMIEYENQQNTYAIAKYQIIINELPKLTNEIQLLLKFLYRKGSSKEKDLLDIVQVKLSDLRLILHTLFKNGLIHKSDICGYSLTDMGHRAAKQLNKK